VVTGVEPFPVILPGPGKVVLTTFHHASSDLIDLYLSPQPPTGSLAAQQTAVDALLYPQVSRASIVDQAWERIGVTGNHPIWSEDRHDYVAAMDLRVGERLKNLSGDTVWVQQKLPRPGPTPVYNLEVQDEHVYYVGASGVLAHNACDTKGLARDDAALYRALGGARAGHTAHHLVPVSVTQQRGLKGFFRRAAKDGWDINGASNGLMVDNLIRHVNHHPRYNAYVAQRIQGYIKKAGGSRNVTGSQAKQYLESLSSDLRRYLNNTNGDINKLFEWVN